MRETPKAAAAFEEYAAMGPSRSLRKLAEKLHQSSPKSSPVIETIKVWSREHQWQKRVKEYDAERIEEKRLKRDAEIEKMNDEQALIGRTQLLRAVKRFDDLIKADKFGAHSAVQLFKYASDLERVARGASTEQIALTGRDGGPIETHSDTDDLTEDDLQLVVEMAARLRAQRGEDVDSVG